MVVWYCVVLCGAGGRGSKKARTPALTSSVLPRHPNTIEGGGGGLLFSSDGEVMWTRRWCGIVWWCAMVCLRVGRGAPPFCDRFCICVFVFLCMCEIACVHVCAGSAPDRSMGAKRAASSRPILIACDGGSKINAAAITT